MANKILMIDDEQVSRALIKFGLAQENFDILTASDGIKGMEMVKRYHPDIIILDVQMPNMNGYEFMEELNKQGITTPVIVLTANQTLENLFKLEGIKGYFVKPVNMEKLVDKIRECLKDSI